MSNQTNPTLGEIKQFLKNHNNIPSNFLSELPNIKTLRDLSLLEEAALIKAGLVRMHAKRLRKNLAKAMKIQNEQNEQKKIQQGRRMNNIIEHLYKHQDQKVNPSEPATHIRLKKLVARPERLGGQRRTQLKQQTRATKHKHTKKRKCTMRRKQTRLTRH